MSLIVQNNSGGVLDINDLGVTLQIGATLDLSESADPPVIVNSSNGGDLDSAITLGNLTVKDPIGGGNLSVADGLAAVRAMNDSNWRHGAGARINDHTDVNAPSPSNGDVLIFNSGTGDWEPATGTSMDERVKVSSDDTTTGYLEDKIVAATNEIALQTLNGGGDEDLEIGFADNPIIPGSEGVTVPTGTTGERPGTPNNGEMRLNETLGQMEYYWNGNWVTFSSSGGFGGSIQAYHFLIGGKAEDKWMGSTTNHLFSDEEPYVLPWDVNIVAVGFSNKTAGCYTDVEFYQGVKTGASAPFTWTSTRLFTLQLRTSRVAYASDLNYSMSAGDVLGCYVRKIPSNLAAELPLISVYVQITGSTVPVAYTAYETVLSGVAGGKLAAAASAETNPAKIVGP